MKKFIVVLSTLFVLAFSASAQDKFYPDWFWGIKGGATYTSGEASQWTDLISAPALAVNVGYQFVPCFGLRAELGGYQAKGAAISAGAENLYKFNFAQLNVDAVLDICNIFKFKAARVVNPYIFLGIGGNLRFNNGAVESQLPTPNYYWTKATPSFTGRYGGGIDFRVSPSVAITLEAAENFLTDHFNSKIGDAFSIGNAKMDTDQNITALIGLKFTFGAAKQARLAAEAAAAAAAAEEAARLAAEKAAAEKAAAEKAAAEKAAREAEAARIAAEKAAAEKAAAEKAAAEKAAHEKAIADAIADPTKNVYFTIGSYYIRKSEYKKVQDIAKLLKETGEKITLRGYADKETGRPETNMPLSQHRVEAVQAALIKLGVNPSVISTEYYGDTERVSEVPAKNRVAICICE